MQLHVGNIYVDVIGEIPEFHWPDIQKKLSFQPLGFIYSPLYNKWITDKNGKKIRRVWNGWKSQIWKNKKRTYFKTGLYSLFTDYLKEHNIPYQVIDKRKKPEQNLFISVNEENLLPRDYQEESAEIGVAKQRGMFQIATGGGKTATMALLISKLKVSPVIFFVTSIDLLEQAKEELTRFLFINGETPNIGQIGDGQVNIQDINIMTVQTAVRALGKQWDADTKFDDEDQDDETPIESKKEEIKNLIHNAALVICDEVQHWRAETCQIINDELYNAYYKYGCSATPYRDDGDDLMIMSCFGKNIVNISASELIKKNWLIKPEIKMIHLKGETSKFKQWQSIYKEKVVEDEVYNGIIANITNAYIEQNRLVLVLIKQINHGKILEQLIPGSVFISGKSPKQKRLKEINRLRNREINCIISSMIFDEGIDVRPLDTLILAGHGKSKVRAMQRIGRILRPFPGKTKATALDFCLYQKYLKTHAKERLKMYQSEPEYAIEEIHPT